MKKTVKAKAKPVKKAKNSAAPRASARAAGNPEIPDFISVMMKFTERLEAVEKKIEQVLNQTAARTWDAKPVLQDSQPPQNQQRPQPQAQPHPVRHEHLHPQHQSQNQGNTASQPSRQNRGRHGKPLFQAVCADCRKHCEVPFKPTGERPVYCKECFTRRKAVGNSLVTNGGPSPEPMQKRQLKVIPNGGGRVVISEMVPVSSMTAEAPAPKNSRPAKTGFSKPRERDGNIGIHPARKKR